jgi:hypothetical protein
MSDIDIVDGAVDFRMMTRQMVDAILELNEVQRFSKGIFTWVGFRTKWIEFENVKRIAGETKWSFWKLFKYALDGITAFTKAPLRFASFVGVGISAVAFCLLIYELIRTMIFGIGVPGYLSTLFMLTLVGGIMILTNGILGEYIAKMYLETKRRPIYIAKSSNIQICASADAAAKDGVSAETHAGTKDDASAEAHAAAKDDASAETHAGTKDDASAEAHAGTKDEASTEAHAAAKDGASVSAESGAVTGDDRSAESVENEGSIG